MAHANTSHESQVRYVAAGRTIAAGEIVKQEDLDYIDWPSSRAVNGAFTKSDEVIGHAAVFPLEKGQLIVGRYLATAGSAIGLTTKIPDGMRAIALKSDEVVGVAGFLFPGSRVDVLVTYHSYQSPEATTTTVLQDAQIVAVGQKIQPDPEGKPSSVDVVTILAKPNDAEKVVLASTQGTIHFVLRNGGDHADAPFTQVQLAQFGNLAPTPRAWGGGHRNAAQMPKAERYVVETVLGDKKSTVSFD